MRPTLADEIAKAAEALVAAGRSEEALRLFRRALDLEAANARATVGQTRLLLATGELHAAVDVANSALSAGIHDVRLLALHGDIGLAL